jgi:ATP phosphoribosyltransferase regulatory subunit HisZ
MNLTQEQLETIQQMNTEYTRLRMSIADFEMNKYAALNAMEALREKFSNHERLLIELYGQDAVINMKTGEITKKEKE